jgi:hypothetical protein
MKNKKEVVHIVWNDPDCNKVINVLFSWPTHIAVDHLHGHAFVADYHNR